MTAVQQDVAERTGYPLTFFTGTNERVSLQAQIAELLSDSLAADEAVQIALVNNRQLQAEYETLGIAQTDLVQAGLYENPVFGAHTGFPLEEEHAADLAFSVSFNFLDLFYAPMRKRVAASRLEEARLQLTARVMLHTGEVLDAYYAAQAAGQTADMFAQVSRAAEASYEASRLLFEAGNIPELDLHAEQASYEQTRLDLINAEVEVQQRRETLSRLMGLRGDELAWDIPRMLPSVADPPQQVDIAEIEARVVEASVDLALAAQRIKSYSEQAGVINATSLLPHLELGAEAEREGAWEAGPEIEFPLPLFDSGASQRARAAAEIRRQQAAYDALAVTVRSQARVLSRQLQAAVQAVQHNKHVLIPLRSSIAEATQLQFNAMQIGLFEIITARRQEVLAGKQYLDALAHYWTVKTAYDLLVQGKLSDVSMLNTTAGAAAPPERGH